MSFGVADDDVSCQLERIFATDEFVMLSQIGIIA